MAASKNDLVGTLLKIGTLRCKSTLTNTFGTPCRASWGLDKKTLFLSVLAVTRAENQPIISERGEANQILLL